VLRLLYICIACCLLSLNFLKSASNCLASSLLGLEAYPSGSTAFQKFIAAISLTALSILSSATPFSKDVICSAIASKASGDSFCGLPSGNLASSLTVSFKLLIAPPIVVVPVPIIAFNISL